MEILNVRVDSRGIHGQVQTTWIPQLGINRIVVIDDDAIKDSTQKMALKLAKPNGTKLSILSSEKGYTRLQENAYPDEKALILFLNLDTVKKITNKGFNFKHIILGNIPNRENTRNITKTINLTPEEISIVNELIDNDVELTYQMVPSESPIKIDHI